jgi:hypothetical protein
MLPFVAALLIAGASFPRGLGPIDTGAAQVSSAACKDCHARAYEEWAVSRHGRAWTNAIFQREYRQQPLDWCVHCHAPLREQFVQVKAGGGPLADEGVGCVACHVRGGQMLARTRRAGSPHDTAASDDFGGPAFCGGCHQFNFPLVQDEGTPQARVTGYSRHPMQNTVAQHAAGPHRGTECLTCHGATPGGHLFPGGHDAGMRARAVTVETCRAGNTLAVTLANTGAGHDVPTGDLHRHLVLRAWRPAAPERLHEVVLGRRFEPAPDGGKRTTVDTSLRAGEARRIAVPVARLGPGTAEDSIRVDLRLVYTIDEFPFRGRELAEPTFGTMYTGEVRFGALRPCGPAPRIAAADLGLPTAAAQVVLVVTDGWDAPRGSLVRLSRADGGGWARVGDPVPVVVGRAGLGWGRGLHRDRLSAAFGGPVKREGDGRAPAGVFTLGEAFGYAPAPPAGVAWPYRPSDADGVCVDDPRSPEYNRLARRPPGKAPWRSAEPMVLRDEDYRLGLRVDHNTRPVKPGAGSCIFLHIASPPDQATSGCTAMTGAALEAVLRWLDPAKRPALIQLPREVYAAVASSLGLPAAPRAGE